MCVGEELLLRLQVYKVFKYALMSECWYNCWDEGRDWLLVCDYVSILNIYAANVLVYCL